MLLGVLLLENTNTADYSCLFAVGVLLKGSCHNLRRSRDFAAEAVIKFELRRLWKCHRALAPGAPRHRGNHYYIFYTGS